MADETQAVEAIAMPGWLGVLKGRRRITGTELRIIALAVEGLTNKEIGARLGMSVDAVKMTMTRIYNKTGAENKAMLIAAWYREIVADIEVNRDALKRRCEQLEAQLRRGE